MSEKVNVKERGSRGQEVTVREQADILPFSEGLDDFSVYKVVCDDFS